MVVFEFTVDDLARTRFAISPMWEAVSALQMLQEPARAALHLPWLRAVEAALRDLDLRPALTLLPVGGYIPDFLTPPPTGPLATFEDELALVRATSPAQVRHDVSIMLRAGRRRGPLQAYLDEPRALLARVADCIEAFWRAAVEPVWERVHALLEADLVHRARRLAQGGQALLFEDLPHVRWRADRLEVQQRYSDVVPLGGQGLLMVPSAFAWEGPWTLTEAPWQPTLVYPARGSALLWEEGDAAGIEAVGALVGRTRAALLLAAGVPPSTTELARRLGVTAGGASQHLSVLRAAGLVAAERDGRQVLYARTALGDALVSSSGPRRDPGPRSS